MKIFFKPLQPASLFLFLLLMAGILTGNFSPDHKLFAFLILIVLSILLCLTFYLNKTPFIILMGLFYCFGYLSIQFSLYPDLPPHHISHYLDSKKKVITGKVVSFAKHYKKRARITLLCQTIKTDDSNELKVTGKINLNLYRFEKDAPKFGDIIRFKAKIKSVQNFMNPGAFDYERYLKLRGIYGNAYTDIGKVNILSNPDQLGLFSRLIRKIEDIRVEFYYFILNHTHHSKSGRIMASLVTGKKEVIPADMRDLFSKAGVSHLFAISGLHLSIVGFLFFSLFYRGLSFFPLLLISGKSKKIAGLLTIIPLAGYSIFTGFSPSTQRAFIMIVVLLFSFVSEKEKDIISSISLAGMIILLIDSTALFSISFQLSFIAVIFIITGVALLKKYRIGFKKKLYSQIGLMICVTFFANLGTSPLTAHYFNIISPIAMISNVIFIPIIGFIILPLGLICLVFFVFFPFAAGFIIHLCTKLVIVSASFLNILISIPYSWTRPHTLQWIEIIPIYLIIIAIFSGLKGRKKVASVCIGFSFIFIAFDSVNDPINKTIDSNLSITVIDVGQGNSALIQTPDKKNILVDGGGFSDSSSFDTGKFIIAPFLWQKRIKTIDYVILTHPESDHLNGLIFILQNFKVHTLIKNSDKKKSLNYKSLMATCTQKSIEVWEPSIQKRKRSVGKTKLLFFTPVPPTTGYNFNNNSLVFKVIYNQFSILFPGDILNRREEHLSHTYSVDLHSDILLSPHHGSSTSSTKLFLDKVQPKSVIISCGRHNRYGFPDYTVLKRYKNKGIIIYRTDKDGAIFVSSNGKDHNITTYKGG